jgi:hypothetical protein
VAPLAKAKLFAADGVAMDHVVNRAVRGCFLMVDEERERQGFRSSLVGGFARCETAATAPSSITNPFIRTAFWRNATISSRSDVPMKPACFLDSLLNPVTAFFTAE